MTVCWNERRGLGGGGPATRHHIYTRNLIEYCSRKCVCIYIYTDIMFVFVCVCSVRALLPVEVAKLESCKECRQLTAALARPLGPKSMGL